MARAAKRKNVQSQRGLSWYRGFELDPETKRDIGAIFLFVLGAISALALFDIAGRLGRGMVVILQWFLGSGYVILPFLFIGFGLLLIRKVRVDSAVRYVGLFLFMLASAGLLQVRVPLEEMSDRLHDGIGGGIIGYAVYAPLLKIAGLWAAVIILTGLLLVSLLMVFKTSLARINVFARFNILARVQNFFMRRRLAQYDSSGDVPPETDVLVESEIQTSQALEAAESGFQAKILPQVDSLSTPSKTDTPSPPVGGLSEQAELFARPRRKHPKIDLPLELLQGKAGVPLSGDIEENKRIIEKTLAQFGIIVEMGDVAVGPTVTQYTFRPAEGMKLSRIVALQNDLALALAAHPIRIEAPIPGKALVGVEVPNQRVALVPLRDLIGAAEFKKHPSPLPLCLGKDVSGKPYLTDLADMPHLLIAGATGSGKSVMVNCIILSMLYHNPSASTLKFIMVDPKRVELTAYNNIPHLLTPVVYDIDKTINALKWAVNEMDRRLDLLSRSKKKNIAGYNAASPDSALPYIVIIIDELADLMAVAAAEIEGHIVRLAQMARAVGLHLVLATQRPSVDVITGLIKANITARIAFSVASLIDSRTILDASGAEKLVGKGDMLFVSAALSKPKRLQGAYVSEGEIERITSYLRSKDKPDFIEEIVKPSIAMRGSRGDQEYDPLFPEARELVVRTGKASTSFLQRRLRLGYSRAARMMSWSELEALDEMGEPAKVRRFDEPQEDEVDEESITEEDGVEEDALTSDMVDDSDAVEQGEETLEKDPGKA